MNGIALWQVCARYGQLKSEVVYICYSVTIESQVNGAYEDDSFCKQITFFLSSHEMSGALKLSRYTRQVVLF